MYIVIKKIRNSHPILLSITLMVLFIGIFQVIQLPASFFFSNTSGYFAGFLIELIAVLIAIIFLFITGEASILKERGIGFLRGIPVATFPIILSLLALLAVTALPEKTLQPFQQILVFLLYMVSIGMAEEFLFRGCITNIIAAIYLKDVKGIYSTVFLSGLLFGAMHMVNLLSGIHASAVIIQSIVVMPVGALFAAIYLRTRNIWLLVFLHSFNNFAALAPSGLYGIGTIGSVVSEYTPIKLVAIAIYLLPTLYLIRRSKSQEILMLNQK